MKHFVHLYSTSVPQFILNKFDKLAINSTNNGDTMVFLLLLVDLKKLQWFCAVQHYFIQQKNVRQEH